MGSSPYGVVLLLPFVLAAGATACSRGDRPIAMAPAAVPAARGGVTITILGTNDLHGTLHRLPILAGYVDNVRAARAADGGGVVLVDAGDMFQGTLESNLNEGKAVIAAYDAIGYTAAAVGNHEFDFGPSGPAATPKVPGDDPRGALKMRATEATFPLLTANVDDATSGQRVEWRNMPASIRVEVAGVSVGIIGVTTKATPVTTMPANFAGLTVARPGVAIRDEAARLRREGVDVVVVAAHLGTKCSNLTDPSDVSSCDQNEELFEVFRDLPAGAIDVFVAGHTHAGIAHRISDVAVIESFSRGRAFGRVDLRVNASGTVTSVKIHPPQVLCRSDETEDTSDDATCTLGVYEGRPVTPRAEVAAILAPYVDAARQRREERLGVELIDVIPRVYDRESPEGNLIADLMREHYPDADIAMTNGGGLRADLPAGPLTYGALYEAQPFDNTFAVITLHGRHLRQLVANNLAASHGILSLSGLTARAQCKDGQLHVELFDRRGKAITDDRVLTVVTSDFLASGGDGAVGSLGLPSGAVRFTGVVVRDAIADRLRKRGGRLSAADFYDPRTPRLAYPAPRPVLCTGAAKTP